MSSVGVTCLVPFQFGPDLLMAYEKPFKSQFGLSRYGRDKLTISQYHVHANRFRSFFFIGKVIGVGVGLLQG